ncbi:ABC transporter permease [Zavarzinia sp. CC-PAN008]|uniref:ABC transporter permease n=1 Tax=Zavarzinia sp. CC-PAN008 TaxID=3243332 RepID=UPI003F74984C
MSSTHPGPAARDRSFQRYTPGFSFRRIGALVQRYWYLLIASWPRMLDLAYWPVVQMVSWGFLSEFLSPRTDYIGYGFSVLIGGVMLWDILYRSQIGLSMSFFEEMWSRNLGHLMVSPLRPTEFMVALLTMSVIRTLCGVLPATFLAMWFFGFSLFDLGLMLVVFFVNLVMMGWAMGLLVSGLVMRNGMGAEGLAWAITFGLAPISAVYYPLSVLPEWLQWIALCLPSTHVFEGMRALIHDHVIRWDHLGLAFGMNLVLLGLAAWAFLAFFRASQRRGKLLQMGE